MASPVVQSSSSAVATGNTQITVTAPTGITEGDLLLAGFATVDTTDHTHGTPSGWTVLENGNGGTDGEFTIFYKVATSADESATDYTFTAGASNRDDLVAAILRIDGTATGAAIQDSDLAYDADGGNINETVSATPVGNDTLIVLFMCAMDNNLSANTVDSYASTPTETYTEVLDVDIFDGANDGVVLGIATADHAGSTEFTNIQGTFNANSAPRASFGAIAIINGPANASGTNTLVSTTSSAFSQSGTADGVASNDLVSASASAFSQNGIGKAPTQWTNESQVSTTWTNQDKV